MLSALDTGFQDGSWFLDGIQQGICFTTAGSVDDGKSH